MSRKKIKLSFMRRKLPDIKFDSMLITRFTNHMMKEGKKNIAMKIIYSALREASQQLKIPEKEVVEKAVNTVRTRDKMDSEQREEKKGSSFV